MGNHSDTYGDADSAAESVDAVEAPAGTEYRVTGPHRVHDTEPGRTFTATLDPGQEAFLIEVGHITPVRLAQSDATHSADSADKE